MWNRFFFFSTFVKWNRASLGIIAKIHLLDGIYIHGLEILTTETSWSGRRSVWFQSRKHFSILGKSCWTDLWCSGFSLFYHRILNNLRWPAGKIMNSALNRKDVVTDASLICSFQAALLLYPALLLSREMLCGWFDNELGAPEFESFNFVISWYFLVCYYSVGGSNCPPSITQTLSVGQHW